MTVARAVCADCQLPHYVRGCTGKCVGNNADDSSSCSPATHMIIIFIYFIFFSSVIYFIFYILPIAYPPLHSPSASLYL